MKTKLTTYPLRLPKSLRDAVERASSDDGTSINQFVVTAVAEKLSALKTADYIAARSATADIAAAKKILRREGGQPPSPEDTI